MNLRLNNGILFFCLCLFSSVNAQQLLFKKFSFDEGLNSYGINIVKQDKYGFIWVGTQDGLYRYNGKKFERLNSSDKNALAGNFFFDFAIDDNYLYAASYNKGIDKIDIRTLAIQNLIIEDSIKKNALYANLLVLKTFASNNKLWVGGKNFLAFNAGKNNTLTTYTMSDEIFCLKQLSANILGVGINNQNLLLYNINTGVLEKKIIINLTNNLKEKSAIKDILLEKDTLYIALETGIVKGVLKNLDWTYISFNSFGEYSNLGVTCFVKDNDQNFWLSTAAGLLKITLKNKVLYKVDKENTRGLLDNKLNNLFLDNIGNLWIANSKNLQMLVLKRTSITPYTGNNKDSDKMYHLYKLAYDSIGSIIAAGTDGLYKTNINTNVSKKLNTNNTFGLVHTFEFINANKWIVSTDLGQYYYNVKTNNFSSSELVNTHPEWKPFAKNYFSSTLKKNNIIYWGSEEEEGLLKWDISKKTIEQYKLGTSKNKGIPENNIHGLKYDKDGNMWILMDNHISKFDFAKDSIVKTYAYQKGKEKLNAKSYFDMIDLGNTLYFSTYGAGVACLNKQSETWTFINESNGITNNNTYGLLAENDSTIWVSSNYGLSRLNTNNNKAIGFYYNDGLHDNCFDEQSVTQVKDKLYFGGINGFSEINLKKINDDANKELVYIYKLEYMLNTQKIIMQNLFFDEVVLPNEATGIKIYLAILNSVQSEKIKFKYKITELSDEYFEVDMDNVIHINKLSYGKFKVVIGYIKNNTDFIECKLEVVLNITPKWYQTWWFKTLVVLGIIGLGYLIYKVRVKQIVKEQKIKNALASDLHDELGSSLTGLKVYAYQAKKNPEYIANLEEGISQSIKQVREMIWQLNEEKLTVYDLINKLAIIYKPLLKINAAELITDIDSSVAGIELQQKEKSHLYLILKEIINNAMKYAQASTFTIKATKGNKRIAFTLTDNGIGIANNNKGYGLKNMQQRAKEIGYSITCNSSSSGTEYLITK